MGNLRRLLAEWETGQERFERPGAVLLGAWLEGNLVGVGGVTPEERPEGLAARMRRFYVAPASRRRGVGRALVARALEHALALSPRVVCNARASAWAPAFWEAQGFAPCAAPGITHAYRPERGP